MFAINHAATALVVKKRYPQTPMWLLLISVQLVELLWVGFNYLGIEYSTIEDEVTSVTDVHLTHMPYSHSILSTLLLASITWFVISKWFKKPEFAIAAVIAISSHLLLDLMTHNQDIALAPFTSLEKLGLSLYAVPLLAFAAETLYGIFCWWVYRGNKLLLATIVGFNLANFTFFSTAIVGPEALLANNPLLLTTLVFIQIVVTLVLVGLLSRRGGELLQQLQDPRLKTIQEI
jgi:membrane-bound metal-dependent hydrolase YbcI (DUF457 family)